MFTTKQRNELELLLGKLVNDKEQLNTITNKIEEIVYNEEGKKRCFICKCIISSTTGRCPFCGGDV